VSGLRVKPVVHSRDSEAESLVRSLRNWLLLAASVTFVAMVTGLTLQLHLLSLDNPDSHNSNRCAVCQQLLIAPHKFVPQPEPQIDFRTVLPVSTKPYPRTYFGRFFPASFNPRPPPFLP